MVMCGDQNQWISINLIYLNKYLYPTLITYFFISYFSWSLEHIGWGVIALQNICHFVRQLCSLRWSHNGCNSVSNHQPHDCLLNRLFKRRSKKTSKLCVTGLCVGNSPGTGEFPAQMASYAENGSIWWRHHVEFSYCVIWLTSLIYWPKFHLNEIFII